MLILKSGGGGAMMAARTKSAMPNRTRIVAKYLADRETCILTPLPYKLLSLLNYLRRRTSTTPAMATPAKAVGSGTGLAVKLLVMPTWSPGVSDVCSTIEMLEFTAPPPTGTGMPNRSEAVAESFGKSAVTADG